MKCLKCGGKTMVRRTNQNEKDNEVYRKRKCLECGFKFYTIEYDVEYTGDFRKNYLIAEMLKNERKRKNE